MAGRYPEMEPLRELRYTMEKLKLSDLAIGNDNRNRCLLSAYGTKTARHAPSNSKYFFGPAKWIRHFIAPPPGRALIHRDYSQQEVRIAAVKSGDGELLRACESGDVYLGIAQQLGFIKPGMVDPEIKAVRTMFKTVVLGIIYGLGPYSLAVRTGISVTEAIEILARLRARFRTFEAFAERAVDRAGLDLEISTEFDWRMRCRSEMNSRTIRNFPVQSCASEILHVLVVLAERRGLPIVAPVHDAVMVEVDAADADDASVELDRAMSDASAVLLKGYELPTDVQIVRPGEHFVDERGAPMWATVSRLIDKLESKRA
jgi:DNA polymerase I-like protein with 3'-5' exonuclease and polymerase domains